MEGHTGGEEEIVVVPHYFQQLTAAVEVNEQCNSERPASDVVDGL